MLLVKQLETTTASHSWLQAAPLALLTTVGLFVFMERLIAFNDFAIDESPAFTIPEITWKEPPKIVPRIAKVEKIDKPSQPPEIPNKPQPTELNTRISIPSAGVNVRLPGKLGTGFASNLPVIRLMSTAVYPRGALARGIEGYVDLRFDVSAIGETENIEVIAANPSGVFEKAAVKAAQKWRFQPTMNNGQGERFVGMSKRVKFEIQK